MSPSVAEPVSCFTSGSNIAAASRWGGAQTGPPLRDRCVFKGARRRLSSRVFTLSFKELPLAPDAAAAPQRSVPFI